MTDRNVDPYCKGVDENGYHDPLTTTVGVK